MYFRMDVVIMGIMVIGIIGLAPNKDRATYSGKVADRMARKRIRQRGL